MALQVTMGHIKDSATGLNPCILTSENCTVQARYYDPVIGRFLSIDPVTFIGSGGNPGYFNRYAYTMNDPINAIDPTGMSSEQLALSTIQGRAQLSKEDLAKVQHSERQTVVGFGTAVRGAFRSVKQSARRNIGAKFSEKIKGNVEKEDKIISGMVESLISDPKKQADAIEFAKTQIEDNPGRVGGRFAANLVGNVAIMRGTKAGKSNKVDDLARTGTGVISSPIFAAIGASGDVREAVQRGATTHSEILDAFLNGRVE